MSKDKNSAYKQYNYARQTLMDVGGEAIGLQLHYVTEKDLYFR